MGHEFEVTVTIPRTYTFETGWGVWLSPVYEWNDDTNSGEGICDVDGGVVRIDPAAVQIVGGIPCLAIGDRMFWPVENFEHIDDHANDDEHDLRSRFFETEDEARDHLAYTLTRFANPSPWESFIKL